MLTRHQIRVMYDQGVAAVTETMRQLYEMIEVEDERVHRLVVSATAAHLEKIEQRTGRIARLEEELSNKVRQVHQLKQQLKDLTRQLKEARQQTRLAREAHLATVMKNSQNSSLPPSTDRRKRTKSLREQSSRKPGGQVGHRGATKEMVEQPDQFVIHAPETCSLCGSSLGECEVRASERRQVHDLPPPKIEVVEHQAQTKVCHRCGTKNKAKFPRGVNAPAQYGKGIRTAAAYLLGYQLLPFERCAEAMNDLFKCQLSAGTLATIFKECAGELSEPLLLIKEGISQSEVIGVDETNLRVQQKQEWVHVSSTDKLTLLCHDKRRGTAAIENIGILASYKGVCVHDGFSAYDQYRQCRHSLCNAHILRELNYVIETGKPSWATEMKTLLLEIKAAVGKARGDGKKRLAWKPEKGYRSRYEQIIAEAGKLYPPLKRKKYRAKTRRQKESPMAAAARKLANRLAAKRDQILLFMRDFRVPFDRYERRSQRQSSPVPPYLALCFDGLLPPRRMA